MDEVTLSSLSPGERGVVVKIAASTPAVRQRLLEMGLVKGTPLEVIRYAPMGDPIEVKVRGYRLSLRKGEAAAVHIKKDLS